MTEHTQSYKIPEHIRVYKAEHPNEGCQADCKFCVKCGSYYCLKLHDRFESPDSILCAEYKKDQIKEISTKTPEMLRIDQEEAEEEVHRKEVHNEKQKIEQLFQNHAKECPEFKIVLNHLYRSFQDKNGSILFANQIMRSYFHHCPACGHEFGEEF